MNDEEFFKKWYVVHDPSSEGWRKLYRVVRDGHILKGGETIVGSINWLHKAEIHAKHLNQIAEVMES